MRKETHDPNCNPLDALAACVSGNPLFLGSVLAAYQERHGLDDAGLAAVLGCSLDALTSLRLCRRPGVVEPQRRVEEERTKIAGRFGVDPVALKRVVAVALPAYVVTPHPWRVPSEGGNRFRVIPVHRAGPIKATRRCSLSFWR